MSRKHTPRNLDGARNVLYESIMDYSAHELREIYLDTHSDVDVLQWQKDNLEMCKEDGPEAEERVKELEADVAFIEDEIRQQVNAIDPSGKLCTDLRLWMQAARSAGVADHQILYLFNWTFKWYQEDKSK